jgi:hypothetical protein
VSGRRIKGTFSITAAVATRMSELGMTVDGLAESAGVPPSAVRWFGLCHHGTGELERLSAALDWPPGHLRELWNPAPETP